MKTKDYVLIGVVALFLVLSFFLTNNNKKEVGGTFAELLARTEIKEGINTLEYNYFEALTKAGKENTIVYLGSSSCGWCTKFKPILEEVVNENKLKVIYIDLGKVSQTEYNNIQSAVGNNFSGTPTTLIMNGNKVIDALGGYTEKENVEAFFKTNGFIK